MTSPVPRRIVSRRRVVVWLLLSLAAVGVLLQVTLRDAWQWPTAVVFYAMPWPVLSLLTAVAALAARRLSAKEFRIALFAAVMCASRSAFVDFRWSSSASNPSPASTWRVAVWNAAHLPRGVRVATDVIRQWDADVIGIVEAGTTYQLELEEWQRALPEYQIVRPRPQMLLIARGRIREPELKSIGRHSDVALARIERGSEVLDIALVDIISSLSYGRATPLRNLAQILEERNLGPHVVMGDFNTPPESVWFAPLRARYQSAFEIAGSGYRATWPVPAPALQLDFLWVGSQVHVKECHHDWTTASDHRPVIADITIATTVTSPPDFPPE